ncbi:MAG: HPr family phosphocarrier protein [Eubacterium sp.]|nr:HPr family phosphocarrier protein [Eubacterium sp.]
MSKRSIDVQVNEDGARMIAMLVQIASRFQSEINISQDNKTVNAKSIMGMMTLGLNPGQQLEVSADGDDAEKALDTMEQYLAGAN